MNQYLLENPGVLSRLLAFGGELNNAQVAVLLLTVRRMTYTPPINKLDDDTPEPSPTWRAQFLKCISDLDEDLYVLWSRVLEDEIRKPGSFSLESLELLHRMEKQDVQAFTKVAQYVFDGKFVPSSAIADLPIDRLISQGLLLPNAELPLRGHTVQNIHFQVHFPQDCSIEKSVGYQLSEPAQELHTLMEVNKADYCKAMLHLMGSTPVDIEDMESYTDPYERLGVKPICPHCGQSMDMLLHEWVGDIPIDRWSCFRCDKEDGDTWVYDEARKKGLL